jgi:hypothetical protein
MAEAGNTEQAVPTLNHFVLSHLYSMPNSRDVKNGKNIKSTGASPLSTSEMGHFEPKVNQCTSTITDAFHFVLQHSKTICFHH